MQTVKLPFLLNSGLSVAYNYNFLNEHLFEPIEFSWNSLKLLEDAFSFRYKESLSAFRVFASLFEITRPCKIFFRKVTISKAEQRP